MNETALKCSCCNTYRPIEWFDKYETEGGDASRFSSCFPCRRKMREWKTRSKPERQVLPIIPEGHKYCPYCHAGQGAVLPLDKFGPNKRRKDGYDSRCRTCQNVLNARRRATRTASRGTVNSCLQDVLKLTPQVVQDRLAAGLIPDQVAGYWMKPTRDDKPPCWKEIRDYTNAWNHLMAR